MLPNQTRVMPVSVKNNDPKGNEYFFLKKGKLYLRIHVDRKTTIDRPARDKDKEDYAQAWETFNKENKQELKHESTDNMSTSGRRHRHK